MNSSSNGLNDSAIPRVVGNTPHPQTGDPHNLTAIVQPAILHKADAESVPQSQAVVRTDDAIISCDTQGKLCVDNTFVGNNVDHTLCPKSDMMEPALADFPHFHGKATCKHYHTSVIDDTQKTAHDSDCSVASSLRNNESLLANPVADGPSHDDKFFINKVPRLDKIHTHATQIEANNKGTDSAGFVEGNGTSGDTPRTPQCHPDNMGLDGARFIADDGKAGNIKPNKDTQQDQRPPNTISMNMTQENKCVSFFYTPASQSQDDRYYSRRVVTSYSHEDAIVRYALDNSPSNGEGERH